MTKEDLEQIGKVIDDRIEPLKQGQARLEQGQVRLEQGQAQLEQRQVRLEQGQAQIKTVLKVLEAGQNDIRENMASKADILDIKTILVKHQRRIENLEENTKTPNPHKN